MRTHRGRAKKLIVAFHFQSSRQAGWRCDTCRKAGLATKRRCAFSAPESLGPSHVVWARGNVAIDVCPRSVITPQSVSWLEQYYLWKRFGARDYEELEARTVEAFLLLEEELIKEEKHGG